MKHYYRKPLITLVAAISVFALNMPFAQARGWTFNVANNGKSTVLKVEASEDGNTWSEFTGSEIKPGETVKMEWASSTDNSNCTWQVRAIYADGPSEPASFDFCKQPDLEFNN